VVMLHPLSSGTTIKEHCRLLSCDVIFILDLLEKRYEKHLNEFKTVVISASNSVKGPLALGLKLKQAFSSSKTLRWDKIQADHDLYESSAQSDAVILFSSGSSGKQKAIKLSDEAFNALVDQMETVINPERGIDSMFCVLPFFHGFGLGISMHTVMTLGGRCILVPRLTKDTIIKTFLKEKPTYIAAVPYLLKVFLSDIRFTNADLSYVKQVFVGGESVSLSLINEFNRVLENQGSKAKVQVGYGCTETVTAVTLMDVQDSGSAGVGKPFKGNTIIILKEDGSLASENETGEILISGPVLMNGYFDNEAENKRVLVELDGVLAYRSGDIGHLDQSGILHFHHRLDDQIKVKGFMISPQPITDCLLQVNGIQEARILVDENDVITAILTVKENSDLKTIQKETTQVLKELDGWTQPKQFFIIKAMPLNEMRKIDMNGLRDGIKNRALQSLLEWSL
jgi:long-chain acyl-CoA synthetase